MADDWGAIVDEQEKKLTQKVSVVIIFTVIIVLI